MHYSINDSNMFDFGSVVTPLVMTLDAEVLNFPAIYSKLNGSQTILYNDYTNSIGLSLTDPFESRVFVSKRIDLDTWICAPQRMYYVNSLTSRITLTNLFKYLANTTNNTGKQIYERAITQYIDKIANENLV